MRRTLSCVLMMTLLLTACGGSGEESAENLAARVRAEYLSLAGWTGQGTVTADWGEKVFEFGLDIRWKREGETVLTVTSPQMVAGITARIRDGEGWLEYDGASLSIGPITGEGMTPMEAVPFVMEQLLSGYMARCSYVQQGERQLLQVVCRDGESGEGEGTECTLLFDRESHDLLGAEISWDGFTVLRLEVSDFTKEGMDHDTTDHEDLG